METQSKIFLESSSFHDMTGFLEVWDAFIKSVLNELKNEGVGENEASIVRMGLLRVGSAEEYHAAADPF